MRKFLAFNLIIALLAPWIVALSGVTAPVVPCPMHRQTAGDRQMHDGMDGSHRQGSEHKSSSHHDTTARGCNCAGECGRSGTPFSLGLVEIALLPPATVLDAMPSTGQPQLASDDHLLPLSTGPPQRLRI